MKTASSAGADAVSQSRRAVAALVRAPKIPQRKSATAPGVNKRAAVVLRRGMKPLEFRQVEAQLDALQLTCLPVLPGQRKANIADTPVCGLIVTGGDMEPSPMERQMIEAVVLDMLDRKAPVLAMSDAASMVLEAAGLDAAAGEACAVLVHDGGVRVLSTPRQVDDAIKLIAKAPAR